MTATTPPITTAPAPAAPAPPSPGTDDAAPDLRRLAQDWFRGKSFTTDWVSNKIPRWHKLLGHLGRDTPLAILELGSFEGRSAVFLARYFRAATLTCVDLFPDTIEARFDANIAEFGARIEKMKGSAVRCLDQLAAARQTFDLVYVDAGKARDHVLALSLLSWPLAVKGGIIIWDDYSWGEGKPSEERPHDAIDIFLALQKGKYDLLFAKDQVFVRKTIAGR